MLFFVASLFGRTNKIYGNVQVNLAFSSIELHSLQRISLNEIKKKDKIIEVENLNKKLHVFRKFFILIYFGMHRVLQLIFFYKYDISLFEGFFNLYFYCIQINIILF